MDAFIKFIVIMGLWLLSFMSGFLTAMLVIEHERGDDDQ